LLFFQQKRAGLTISFSPPSLPPPVGILATTETEFTIHSPSTGLVLSSASFPEALVGPPKIVDFNGDGVDDIIAESEEGMWWYRCEVGEETVGRRVLGGVFGGGGGEGRTHSGGKFSVYFLGFLMSVWGISIAVGYGSDDNAEFRSTDRFDYDEDEDYYNYNNKRH